MLTYVGARYVPRGYEMEIVPGRSYEVAIRCSFSDGGIILDVTDTSESKLGVIRRRSKRLAYDSLEELVSDWRPDDDYEE